VSQTPPWGYPEDHPLYSGLRPSIVSLFRRAIRALHMDDPEYETLMDALSTRCSDPEWAAVRLYFLNPGTYDAGDGVAAT
jgi:hypothetical protein